MSPAVHIIRLSDLQPDDMGVCFVLLESRERRTTRDDKPYYRYSFRDAGRATSAMIWENTSYFADCDEHWQVGEFYKVRCRYTEGKFGPQIDLDSVRPVYDEDRQDGFDPADISARTRFNIDEMYDELLELVETKIDDSTIRELITLILNTHETEVKTFPAATRFHHAFTGGFLEHVLSVTNTALFWRTNTAIIINVCSLHFRSRLLLRGPFFTISGNSVN